MSIEPHPHPASPLYPTAEPGGPYASELATAKSIFEAALIETEGWEDQGIREEVQLYKKVDLEDPYAVPTVKGECVVEGVTAAEFLAVITLPGMRKRWDARFDGAHVVSRYSRTSYSFYSVLKGMSWLVWPRDITGVQANYEEADGAVVVIQTSIEDEENLPAQSGKTRASLTVSGWQLLPQGKDLKVTYIVKVSLNGSIPTALVAMVATETPLCTGRARDVFYALGHAPYVALSAGKTDTGVIFQTEALADPGATPEDKGTLEYTCAFTTAANATFDLVYSKTMYPDGVNVSVDIEGAVTTKVLGEKVEVDCGESTGQIVVVSISPK